ncbi:MAG TPA: glycosyltransferase, partial [Acidimicrobiales bacterium]
MNDRPVVGIVVVDFNGGERTLGCIEHLHALTYPADRTRMVLVDNGSARPVVADVRTRWPAVDVVETGENRGFAGGCNAGFRHLLGAGGVDHIALVNNDALPDAGWLEPLVDALAADPTLGAVTPKVLLDRRYAFVDLTSPTSAAGAGDPRQLGVQVVAVRA